jgi:hypothetical protein
MFFLRDAVYGTQYAPYIRYRMRFFLIVSLTTLIINGIEIFIMKQNFSGTLIRDIIIMRIYISIVSLGWWGCLEIMRENIRCKYYFFDIKSIQETINKWMILTIIVGFTFTIPIIPFFLQARPELIDQEQYIFDWYFIGCILQGLTVFPISCYRSGIYAIKRIYRSITSILLPSILTFLLMIYLWQFIGLIGLPISVIFGEVIDSLVSTYYTKKTYSQLKIRPKFWVEPKVFFNFIRQLSKKNIVQTWFAGSFTSYFNLIIIFFLFVNHDDFYTLQEKTELIYIFIVRQIYHAYAHWGMLFYFDLKKLCTLGFVPFYNGFFKKLFPLSFFISSIFFLLACAVTFFLSPQYFWSKILNLAIFFYMAAIFSILIIHSFCRSRFIDIIFSCITSTCIYFLFHNDGNSIYFHTTLLFISLGYLLLFLWRKRFYENHDLDFIQPQSVYNMAARLEDSKVGYQLIKIKTNLDLGLKKSKEFIKNISEQMDQEGWICPITSNVFYVIEKKPFLNYNNLNKIVANIVISSEVMHTTNKLNCLNIIYNEFSKNIRKNRFFKEINELFDVNKLFLKHFPKQLSINLTHSDILKNQSDLRDIYDSIDLFFMKPKTLSKKSNYASSVYFSKYPKLFVVNKNKENFRKVIDWTNFIHYLNFKYFAENQYNQVTSIQLNQSILLNLGHFLE